MTGSAQLIDRERQILTATSRRIVQVERMLAEFERLTSALDSEIGAAESESKIYDLAHFAYPLYAKAARERRDNLKRSIDVLNRQLDSLRQSSGLVPQAAE